MKTYTTRQGDQWDAIAYTQMGSTSYTDALMNANQQYVSVFIFPSGVVLNIPEVEKKSPDYLPPWKRVNG